MKNETKFLICLIVCLWLPLYMGAFDKDKPAASTSLRSSNPEMLTNQTALQSAIDQDHEFSGTSAGTQSGLRRYGAVNSRTSSDFFWTCSLLSNNRTQLGLPLLLFQPSVNVAVTVPALKDVGWGETIAYGAAISFLLSEQDIEGARELDVAFRRLINLINAKFYRQQQVTRVPQASF